VAVLRPKLDEILIWNKMSGLVLQSTVDPICYK